MDKVYHPQQIEQHWYQTWEATGQFGPATGADRAPYCIMIPPPNVTGSLHMGHALQDTLMDVLCRYHRMRGHPTLWQVGTDHAGIATQMVVERQLAADGQSRHDLGREAFVDKIWDWKRHSGNRITQQLRRMGASVDWAQERFTLDPGLSEAVKTVFVALYREGLIYRGQRLVNWDPVLGTAVSDLEVVNEEEPGHLWHIQYPIVGQSDFLTVATTRPETLLGDCAVAVHPEDTRFAHLIGQSLQLPLCDRSIPIIADDYVDPEFGTGCVKITPAHDFNDYEVGMRHQLPLRNIFTAEAKLNAEVPAAYQGLDRFEARRRIVADLEAANLLAATTPHTLKVPRGDRTGCVIEPWLTDQWFVKVASLAQPAIDVVQQGKIKFIPEHWSKTYFEWMHNIQDWCVSRQLWWGHRIPAWFDADGQVYVGMDEADVRAHYQLDPAVTLTQDPDVLDTWFSSALWPFSTLGWPAQTPRLKQFYPTNVLVTGFDIIFFWVARMIMFGLKFTGEIPFREVYIHGLIQDTQGQKMSKSKGNVLDPLDLIDGISLPELLQKRTAGLMQPKMAKAIEKTTRQIFPEGITAYGTDALRFTLCSLATTGRHIRFDLKRLEGYRNFCNKLWNASRYVLMQVAEPCLDAPKRTVADRWILSRWQQTKQVACRHIENYRFDLLATTLYEFTWNNFCDWYLELSKPILNQATIEAGFKAGTQQTLITVLTELLHVLHPIIPFITEAIYAKVVELNPSRTGCLMVQPFPSVETSLIDPEADTAVQWVQGFITQIRNIRGEMNVSPNRALTVLLDQGSDADKQLVASHQRLIKDLTRISEIRWLDGQTAPPAAIGILGALKIMIPMAGLIDKDAELQRLSKEIDKLTAELHKCQTKLANPNYVAKAPAEVVQKEQLKVTQISESLQKLKTNQQAISAL